jgi:hypothetical protein
MYLDGDFHLASRDSSVGIATGYGLDGWSSSPVGDKIFLLSTSSRTAMGPTQPIIQWAQEGSFAGVKRPERGADHSPPSSAEVKNTSIYTPIRLHGVVLKYLNTGQLYLAFTKRNIYVTVKARRLVNPRFYR